MKNDISINQDNFTQNVKGFEDIKQCWKNILFTIPGSIPLMPTFGCDIWQFIDKPTSDSFGKARNVIIAALEKWETRAKITKVTRTIEGSKVLVNILGIANTGEIINSQINVTPEPTNDVYPMFIGFVDDLNASENAIKSMENRNESKLDQSFNYTINFKRPCFFFRTFLGSLLSIKDSEDYEIISGFTVITVNFTINGETVSYTGYILTHPTSQADNLITFKFN